MKKCVFYLMSQGSFNLNIRLLGQKVCPVACLHTQRHTDGVTTVGTLLEFQDRPNASRFRNFLHTFYDE